MNKEKQIAFVCPRHLEEPAVWVWQLSTHCPTCKKTQQATDGNFYTCHERLVPISEKKLLEMEIERKTRRLKEIEAEEGGA